MRVELDTEEAKRVLKDTVYNRILYGLMGMLLGLVLFGLHVWNIAVSNQAWIIKLNTNVSEAKAAVELVRKQQQEGAVYSYSLEEFEAKVDRQNELLSEILSKLASTGQQQPSSQPTPPQSLSSSPSLTTTTGGN